ncbi:hypothetical protein QQF64_005692 [Cirrhinus molitorella]|uniref:Uncharacterized protein n=1 Tax=Cirrhinus molitorella TaxID=172907 RepID=A0ABR3MGX6_9TELE
MEPHNKKESQNKARQLQSERTHRFGARWTAQSHAHLTRLSHRHFGWQKASNPSGAFERKQDGEFQTKRQAS